MSAGERQPHVVLDLGSRRNKALKIERLLRLDHRPGPLRLLEIGTGSGGIAHYFGTHPTGRFEVHAVDVVDNRLVQDGYRYQDVQGVALPYPDGHFDVVLSNHVIEHVGERPDQAHHLAELHRVLADDGIAYLAVPNRWMVVEPHFRLAFLSWIPLRLADAYVRLAGKGKHYDCRPLTAGQAEKLLEASGFVAEQVHGEALKLTLALEHPGRLAWLQRLPDTLFRATRKAIPTLIYRMAKRPSDSSGAGLPPHATGSTG